MLYVTKGHLMRITFSGYEGIESLSLSVSQSISLVVDFIIKLKKLTDLKTDGLRD